MEKENKFDIEKQYSNNTNPYLTTNIPNEFNTDSQTNDFHHDEKFYIVE